MSRKDKATALGIRSIRYQIMFVLLPIVVAAMVLLSFLGYDTAKQIIQDATTRQMELNLSSAVTIIEKSLAQNRKVAEGLARSVQSNMGVIQPENFRTLLPLMMESNEETFGGGVLFAPYEYDPSQEWFAPYCMKEGDGITYIDNYSLGEGIYYTDQEFFTAAEATDQSAIWTRPYYDSLVNVSMVTASAPIYDAAGVFIGIATADIDLSNLQQVIVNLQGNEGDRVFLLDTDGTYIADEDAGKLLQETITQDSNPSLAALGEEMLTQKSGTGAFEDQGQTYQVWYTQVPESGWIIAFASPEAQLYGSTNRLGNNLMILCAVLTLVVIIVLAIFIQWMLVRPLKRLADVTSGIAEGNLSAEIRNRSKNEIGVVFASVKKTTERLHEYVDYIDEVSGVLNQIAGGNLDYDLRLHYVGEFEKLKFSLENIRDFMTRTMGDVNEASLKVSAGAKQLADGAQALAQGSVEQAATVQELSASITDVAHKTDENAGMAKKAASLAQVIMQNAEKGSRQMNEMTGAVNDINQSSQGISKVMKVIDDIAFQTNILALNAAVEAARAGQHGKGFAVVADEVRNLAAKSAAAAKDTGAMIADSIGKAKLGAQIATETATSLSEIVSGINESSQLIGEISESSQAQNEGIRQINSAIGNVAQIVQQNSATAEQSAAASHEMSNQADILEKLISQFKLRGQNMRHGDIAAGSNKMALAADSHLELD